MKLTGKLMSIRWTFVTTLGLALSLFFVPQHLLAEERPGKSTAPVFWWWDSFNSVGESALLRTTSGITTVFHTSGLPAGQAVTLWFIFFNNPESCSSNPCSIADMFDPDVAGDFHFASGHIVGTGGQQTFAAHLSVGDTSGSGRLEVGLDEGIALIDPFKAEVLLAIHSHGPALTGRDLKSQISTYLGGCQVFLGPDGFASGPDDVPSFVGECSTVQFSLHQPLSLELQDD